jgi:hypothetical protein
LLIIIEKIKNKELCLLLVYGKTDERKIIAERNFES